MFNNNEYKIIQVVFNLDKEIKILDFDKIRSCLVEKKHINKISNYDLYDINFKKNGIYFLINYEDKKIYIGQSRDVLNRVKNHNRSNKEKGKFDVALLVVDNNNSWDVGTINFLERYFIQKFKDQENYSLTNDDLRESEPFFNKITLLKYNDDIRSVSYLLKFLFKINFEQKLIKKNQEFKETNEEKVKEEKIVELNTNFQNIENEIFIYKDVKLIFKNGDFFILKNSLILSYKYIFDFNQGKNIKYEKQRDSFLKKIKGLLEWYKSNNWIKEYDDDRYITLEDIKVNSASVAWEFAYGMFGSNAKKDFKNPNGLTLGDFLDEKNIRLVSKNFKSSDCKIFKCKDVLLKYENSKFYMLKDSIFFSIEYIEINTKNYNTKKNWVGKRKWINQLLENNLIKNYDTNRYILLKDLEINSPSFAGVLARARNTSGWDAFKNKEGKTLDQVYREK